MKSAGKILFLFLGLSFLLYTLDFFVANGRYCAFITSQISSFFANPHKPVTIEIEVISDQKFAKQDQLLAVVMNSFSQFQPLGINFKMASWRIKEVAPGTEEEQAASGRAKYVMVLSNNEKLTRVEHDWPGVAAYADPQKKMVIVGVKDRALLNPRQLTSTIQHELAHLFYVEHDEGSNAYVMSPVENSSTIWSEQARKTINQMKYRW